MTNLSIINGYRDNDVLRKSFNKLAEEVFGLNFEEWYRKGFWTDKYNPFSIVDGNKIVANVSVNKIDLIIHNEKKRGLQIGTVMTHPQYRNKGLSRELMNHILQEYEGNYDVMYLFANKTVLDFYPKFGFNRKEEEQYYLDLQPGNPCKGEPIQKLDISNHNHLNFIYDFTKSRRPVSTKFGTDNTAELLMFYCLYIFKDHIYYLKEDDVIIFFTQREEKLEVFDLISKTKVDLDRIISKIKTFQTKQIRFHYTPDNMKIPLKREKFQGDEVLFTKAIGVDFPQYVKHPLTSQA